MSQQGSMYPCLAKNKQALTHLLGGGLLGGVGDTLGKTVGGLGNTVGGATSGLGNTVSGATEGLGNTTKGAGQTVSSGAQRGTQNDTQNEAQSIGGKEQTAQNPLGL